MQKLKNFIILLLLVVFTLFVFKGFIVKTLISFFASQTIGVRVSIKKLSWNILDTTMIIKELKIYNPKNFPREAMMDVALLDIDYKLAEILRREPQIKLMVMDVREIAIIKNKEGRLNINELDLTDEGKKKSIVPEFPFIIGELRLNIDQIIHKDYSKEETPLIKTIDAGIKGKKFKNIKSGRKLLAMVLFKALGRTSVKGAKIYALAAFLGPAALPAGVTGVLVSKDHSDGVFEVEISKAYAVALSVLKEIGEVKEESQEKGLIKAEVSGHSVSVILEKESESSVKISASARKLKVPKPDFAGGILYQISKELE